MKLPRWWWLLAIVACIEGCGRDVQRHGHGHAQEQGTPLPREGNYIRRFLAARRLVAARPFPAEDRRAESPRDWVYLLNSDFDRGTEVHFVRWSAPPPKGMVTESRCVNLDLVPLPTLSPLFLDANGDGNVDVLVRVSGADCFRTAIIDFARPRGEELYWWDMERPRAWCVSFADVDRDGALEMIREVEGKRLADDCGTDRWAEFRERDRVYMIYDPRGDGFELQDVVAKDPCAVPGRPRKVKVDFELQTPFALSAGAQMVIGMPGFFTVPPEMSEQLYMATGDEFIPIHGLGDLRGRVEIRDASDALAFCRLRTSPRTCHLIRGDDDRVEVELFGPDGVDSDAVFGDNDFLDVLSTDAGRAYWGFVQPASTLETLGVRGPRVRAAREGWEVQRTLLVDVPDAGVKVARVVETVGPDGSYARTECRLRPMPPHFWELLSIPWW